MSLNFSTNSAEIQAEFKKVMDGNSLQNWVIYGYSQGNDLKVAGSGDGGLEELKDEFEGSKIQYAFCRVLEPVSNLPKFVLISWCGDGVPTSRKGLFNVHVNEVSHYFKGFHLHIQARHEEDVEPANVMQKVKASSGAKYSIQSHVGNPSMAKPPPKPAVFKAPIAAPIKSAPLQAPIVRAAPVNTVDEPKPLYSPASSSYQPVKTNPKPLNTPNAFNNNVPQQAPPVQAKNVSSIANRSQAFNQPAAETSSGYQPIKLAPKPLYGDGVASKPFVPADVPQFGRKPTYGSNTNLGSNSNLGSKTNIASNNNFGSKSNLGSNSNFGSKTNVGSNTNLAARKHSYTPSPRISATNKQQDDKVAEQRRQEERLAEQRRLENEQAESKQTDSGEVLSLQQRMEQVRMRDQELTQKQRAEQEQREREHELAKAREGHAERFQQKQQQVKQVAPVQSYQPPQPVQTYQPPSPVQNYQPPQPVQTYQHSQPVQSITPVASQPADPGSQNATALYDYTAGNVFLYDRRSK